MGMSPAPTIANLYVAIYEATHILPLLNSFLFYLNRFINNDLGIWLHNPDPDVDAANWILFKIQDPHQRNGPQMDVHEAIKESYFYGYDYPNQREPISHSTIYANPMALYQYIPPMSCHPPGTLTGLVFGQVLRIFQLCLSDEDITLELAAFHHRLLDHGYKATNIIPLLIKGIDNANHYLSLTEAQ
jgi:hypothetical protein